jgi:hypothetical protein
MKTATRVARARSPAPGEDLSRTLLSDKPIRRFDTHGSAAFVLRDMELHVPTIFGLRGQRALDRLRRLVRNYTNNQPSPYLVVSLSSGTARHELTDLLSRELGGLTGPLIIAPNTGTRKPAAYRSGGEAAKDKEILIRAAETENSMLLILYGLDEPSMQLQMDIGRNQLRRIDNSLLQMLEEDHRLRDARGIMKMDEELKRELQRMGASLQEAQQRIPGLTNNDFQDDAHADALRSLQIMQMEGMTTLGDTEVQRIAHSLGIIPERMAMLGLASTLAPRQVQEAEAEVTMEKVSEQDTRREERRAEQNLGQTTDPARRMAQDEVVDPPLREVRQAQPSPSPQDRQRQNTAEPEAQPAPGEVSRRG